MSMPLTTQARYLFRDRRLQAKWVIAARYIRARNLLPYYLMPMAGRCRGVIDLAKYPRMAAMLERHPNRGPVNPLNRPPTQWIGKFTVGTVSPEEFRHRIKHAATLPF